LFFKYDIHTLKHKNKDKQMIIWWSIKWKKSIRDRALDNNKRNKEINVIDESNSKWIYAFDHNTYESTLVVSHVHHISLSMNTILRQDFIGHVHFTIYLSILVPPRIISHSPEHMRMTVREGRNARFSCIASGRPAPVIVWDVNGLSRSATVTTSMLEF